MTPLDLNTFSQGTMVPEFSVRIEGVPLAAPVLKAITSVSVDLVTNQPCAFVLQVNDPKFALVDAVQGIFAEGKRVEILMGYARATRSMITGEITSIGADLDEGGGLTLNVEGFDRLHAGTRGTEYREFRDEQTDSDIVREIATDMQLTASVDPSGQRQGRQIQNNVSNLEFIDQLAQANGFFYWVEGETLSFKRTRLGARIDVVRGKNLMSFSTRLSTSGQTSAVEVRGWDAAQKKAFSARVLADESQAYIAKLSATGRMQVKGIGTRHSERVIYADGKVRTIAEAQALGDAELAKQRRALLTAQGTASGNSDIRAGSMLVLGNMGRFSGEYVVETARHDIDQSGYRTSFTVRQHL